MRIISGNSKIIGTINGGERIAVSGHEYFATFTHITDPMGNEKRLWKDLHLDRFEHIRTDTNAFLNSVCASECGRRCYFCVQGNRTGEKENAKQVSNSLLTVDTKGKGLWYHTITERKQRPQGGQNNDEWNRHALC